MTAWDRILESYTKEASRHKIFTDLWRTAGRANKALLIFLFFGVSGGLLTLMISEMMADYAILFSVICLCVFAAIYPAIYDDLKSNVYGFKTGDIQAVGKTNHQNTRYQLFKNSLVKQKVTSEGIDECLDLIDSLIEAQVQNTQGLKKIPTFILGLASGVLAILWKQMDVGPLIVVVVVIIYISVLFSSVSSTFPNALDKAKELKHFMHLYRYEVKGQE